MSSWLAPLRDELKAALQQQTEVLAVDQPPAELDVELIGAIDTRADGSGFAARACVKVLAKAWHADAVASFSPPECQTGRAPDPTTASSRAAAGWSPSHRARWLAGLLARLRGAEAKALIGHTIPIRLDPPGSQIRVEGLAVDATRLHDGALRCLPAQKQIRVHACASAESSECGAATCEVGKDPVCTVAMPRVWRLCAYLPARLELSEQELIFRLQTTEEPGPPGFECRPVTIPPGTTEVEVVFAADHAKIKQGSKNARQAVASASLEWRTTVVAEDADQQVEIQTELKWRPGTAKHDESFQRPVRAQNVLERLASAVGKGIEEHLVKIIVAAVFLLIGALPPVRRALRLLPRDKPDPPK